MKRKYRLSLAVSFLLLAGCQSTATENNQEDGQSNNHSINNLSENEESANGENHYHEDSNHNHDNDDHDHVHNDENHDHSHDHQNEEEKAIYDGYFEDEQIEDRSLSDWEGEWQSVYPFLESGELNEVMEHKAEEDDSMTAEDYYEYYETGYATEVDKINIDHETVTFVENGEEFSGNYDYDGYEILTYEAGNRGVRFIYTLETGDEEMPEYIQFSDHSIYPTEAHHFHLYWGDDREELLNEVTNWPTYYPAHMTAEETAEEMISH